MRSFVLAATLFAGLVGCSRALEQTTPPPPAAAISSPATQALLSTPASLTLDRSQRVGCPLQWTCDFIHYFSSLATCTTSCGGGCERDFNCNGHCICP